VGDRQVDAALHAVGQVHPQPAGDARRQGGKDDLVEPLAAEDVADGPQGIGVADSEDVSSAAWLVKLTSASRASGVSA
jgi:hypothetical protein